jgi:uncharacterized protein with NRDE domain
MSDAELIARLRENQAYEWQDPIWETRIVAADRIEALTKERDAAYASGYSDAEREISNTALGQSNTFLQSQLAKAKHRIEALTEQLAAARQDAKFAEDELEMQEQEACMMENDYIKLEKERDALEAKLEHAKKGLRKIIRTSDMHSAWDIAIATVEKLE